MKKYACFVLLFSLASYSARGQQPLQKEIKDTLKAYWHAGDTNDAEALETYLHPDFRILLFDGAKDQTKVLDRATYTTFIRDKKFGGYPRTAEYLAVNTIGEHMACVQVTLTSPGKPTLKNFYSLVKTQGKWSVAQDFVVMVN